ncbi:DUF4932 domain-containing protein [Dyadobacter sp. CY107]|uniref:DUF4932 domain-containing protein n=1 Tax=Dyadobacter fanqingshengii TaxID=2906443 RepID=UPI001F16891B|nr:DUF4932 domain-containing protein [Dyadobacter fanqingshengii]MCF2504869.1 DUF4932 domain-containing protein [Dyadobacter fanqingshengii]
MLLTFSDSFSQKPVVIKASSKIADTKIGKELRKASWNIDPSIRPDVFDVRVPEEGLPVTFFTDQDSIRFDVKPGSYHEFVILMNAKDSALTAVKGILDVPRARFSENYKSSHSGKTFVEIPAMYELINVAFAITETGKKDNGLIMKSTPYYADVMKWFEQYSTEPVITALNKEVTDLNNSHGYKMDAYAFDFENGTIKPSAIYTRIGNSDENHLKPFIPGLQELATKSKFADFYKAHEQYYNALITSYRDSIGVPEMQKWLVKNFPSTKYDSFKIIFSPLVSSNQSATRFDYDGFKEAQAHVNFPFPRKGSTLSVSKEGSLVRDGTIVFTELNHAFINPESEKPEYAARIDKALSNLSIWNNPEKAAKYYNDAYSSFNEYMNWALVSLRYVDYAPEKDQPALIAATKNQMVNSRGFLKFAEFNQFLVNLYKNRKKGQVLADLYPEIVGWFEGNGR